MEPKFSVGERVNVMNTTEPYVFEAIVLIIQVDELSKEIFYLLRYLADLPTNEGWWSENCLEKI